MVSPQQLKKLEKLASLEKEGGIAILKELDTLESRLEGLEAIVPVLREAEDGAKGDKGEKGDTGERGEKGDTGEKGKDGKDGINGKDGKDGKDGVDGRDGKDGIDGKDGFVDEATVAYLEEEVKKAKLDKEAYDRALGIVDQRTSFLINKVNNLPTSTGSASAFTDLTDVPNSYTGQATKVLRVKASEDGLEFATNSATVSWGGITGTLSDQTDLQTALNAKANSLGADDNYVTDAEKTKLSNLSGTNTGDQDLSGYSLTSHTHTGVYEPADATILKDADIGVTVQAYSAVLAGTTASFTTADETKLDGIAAGAEVNVNADWNSVSGDSQILNKPTISGSNTGDQTSIVGITGTKAQFDTAVTDGNFMYVGDAPTSHTHAIADTTGLQTALDNKVDENVAITGATKTKITYDAKGLVTSGADATTADIADSSNKRYVTDAQLTVIGNTSGTNTGDNATNTQYSGLAASKQDTLVSGTNIKTINSTSLLGSGDIAISGSVADGDKGDITVSASGATWTIDNGVVTAAKTSITGTPSGTKYLRDDFSWQAVSATASPAGSDTQIQFNDASALGADADLTWNKTTNTLGLVGADTGINLTGITNEPSAPSANNLRFYTKKIAGRMVMKAKGPSGIDSPIQNAFWGNNITMWNPTTATAGVWLGTAGAGAGTYSTALPTDTSLYTSLKRGRWANVVTTANQVLGQRNTEAMFFRGSSVSGAGGFFFYTRCGFDVWTNGGRFFAGMATGTTVISNNPSNLNNTVGFRVDSGDNGSITFHTRDTSSSVSSSTGYTITSGKGYDLYIFCAPGSSEYSWRIVDINAGTENSGTQTLSLPVNNTKLTANVLASNAALTTVTSIQLGINKIYVETDY